MTEQVGVTIRATDRTKPAFQNVRNNMDGMRRGFSGMNRTVLQNRRIIQQAGMQMSDFAVQVGGGQSALLAFTQQVPQFVQGFGAIGGVAAALITIFGTLALIMVRTGTSIAQITPLAGVLQSEFEGIARVAGVVKEAFIDLANVMVNNLDRIFVYASSLAGFFAAKWVLAFVAARASVAGLTAALMTLRAFLMRFAFTAAIIGVAELIFQFVRLTKAVGGVGEALGLLRDLALEVFGRIGGGTQALPLYMKAAALGMKRWFLENLAQMGAKFVEFTWTVADSLNNLFGTDLMGADPRVFNDMRVAAADAESAARGLTDAANDMTFTGPLTSLQAIRDAFASLKDDEPIDIRDWFKGGGDEDDPTKKALTFADKVRKILQSGFDQLFDSIGQGADAARDALMNLGKELAKLAAKQAVINFLTATFPNTFGADGFVNLTANANGNAFSGGRVTAFAKGGVVGGATTFPMRNGTGLMGEAGPEAIMPLTRRNGRLGVEASGMMPETNIQIVNNAPAQVRYEPQRSDDGTTMHQFVIDAVNRGTGSGELDRSNRARYGQAPQRKKR